MADVKKYTDQIAKAQKGRDVRDSIVNAINEVSDENNEYNQVKSDILAAQSDIAEKVAKNEQTEQTFAADVKKAEELKQGLDTDITQGTALKSQLDAAVETADTSKKNLDASNTTAEQTKTALDGSVSNAQTLKQSLDSDIAQGTTLKTDLESNITQGTALKSQLDDTVKTADTSKKNLDASNTAAGKTKTALDVSNTTATKTKTDLDASNATASEAKTGLDATNKTAADLVASLGNKITEGTQVKTDIQTTGETAMSNLQAEATKQQEFIKTSIDDTLSISGKAADAAVTGKKIDSLKEELTSKADKTALVKTDRKLDALWKLNQGISYEFQTDDAEAYQKMVQSGAKVASIKSIGGKTIVWNQLLGTGYEDTKTANGITFTNNGDGSITIDGTAARDATFQINKNKSFVLCSGHKYLWNVGAIVNGVSIGNNNYTKFYKRDISAWDATLGKYNGYNCIKVANGTTVSNLTIRPRLFDLTLMFGLGNEPSTPEEFEDMFPADYYPHNAGELMSVPVNEVVEQGKNLLDPETFEQNGVYNVTIGENLNWENIGKHANIPVKENTNYTVSFSDEVNHRFAVALADKNGIVTAGKYYSNSAKAQKYSILTPANTKTMYVSFLDNLEDGNLKVQVEESPSQTTYSPYHKTSHSILQAVLKLDGYGDGINDVCNYVDWENKKYHKRIGRYVVTGDEQFYSQQTYVRDNSSDAYTSMDIGQKQSFNAKLISNKLLYSKWCWSEDLTYDATCLNSTQIHIRILNSSLGITNEASAIEAQNAVKKYCKNLCESGDPIIIYYELAEEEITDISDIIDDTFQEPFEVEAGGTLTFKNNHGDDYRISVPNSEEYVISLAEVAK